MIKDSKFFKIIVLLVAALLSTSLVATQNTSLSSEDLLNQRPGPQSQQNNKPSSILDESIHSQKQEIPDKNINNQYKRIKTSQQFYKLFSQSINEISLAEIVNATHLGNGKEICVDSLPCQFFYYVINPKFDPEELSQFSINQNNNVKNVFIVAGMHGNEYLGPMSLLYSIRHLETQSTRIIIFPVANPSGFDSNQRLVFPSNIDPNRDFPIQQYTKCYQSTSSLIIDHIYRRYHIDLTIALHNGRSEIAWNWGTVREQVNTRTEDEPIYRDIGEWLKFVGGYNKDIQMEEFKIGTMNEVIYPVAGSFEDWAYAASWYNSSVTVTPTKQCPFSPYPFNMTNGLVFLFELGPFQVDEKLFGSQQGVYVHPASSSPSNGYLSRTIRMLKGLVKIPNPRLDLKFTQEKMIIKVNGCRFGQVSGLTIKDKQVDVKYFQSTGKIEVKGNIQNRTVQPLELELQRNFMHDKEQLKSLVVEYSLKCDADWEGKGKTVFGQKRQFQVKQTITLSSVSTQFYQQTYFPKVQDIKDSQYIGGQLNQQKSFIPHILSDNKELIVACIIVFIVLVTVVYIVLILCKDVREDLKQRRIDKLKRKLQMANAEAEQSSIRMDQLSEINLSSDKHNETVDGIFVKSKKIDNYPHFCDTDKSMKNQQLEQPV